MTPVTCQVKHDPENGTYGDCLRACVATMLDLGSSDVPHFYHDGCDAETGMTRVREWLATRGYAPFYTAYDGAATREEVLKYMARQNPGVTYLLYGSTGQGDHVVVCRNDRFVHNPSWGNSPLIGPLSHGTWVVMVITIK